MVNPDRDLKSRRLRRSLEKHHKSALKVIRRKQKALTAKIIEEHLEICGKFCLFDGDRPYTSFEMKVKIPYDFPRTPPTVIETGNKIIPRDETRHINPDGTCCVVVWEEWLIRSKDHTVAAFLETVLHDYLVQQTCYDRDKIWPVGERPHGKEGIVEAYSDLLGIQPNKKKVMVYLNILSAKWPKGHCECPCGSKKNIRNCHREKMWDLHIKIPAYLANRMKGKLLLH